MYFDTDDYLHDVEIITETMILYIVDKNINVTGKYKKNKLSKYNNFNCK